MCVQGSDCPPHMCITCGIGLSPGVSHSPCGSGAHAHSPRAGHITGCGYITSVMADGGWVRVMGSCGARWLSCRQGAAGCVWQSARPCVKEARRGACQPSYPGIPPGTPALVLPACALVCCLYHCVLPAVSSPVVSSPVVSSPAVSFPAVSSPMLPPGRVQMA